MYEVMFSSYSSLLWWMCHLLGYFILATCISFLEVHSYSFAGLHLLFELDYNYGIYLVASILFILFAYWYGTSSGGRSSMCSVAVQTDVDSTSFTCISGPASVFISKTGSCYHVSHRCPANGSNTAVQEFRRCRNCG